MAAQTYDEVAPKYDAAMRPLERWFLKRWRAELFAELPKGGVILEVGAGTGLNFAFYPQAAVGVAIEPSIEMLKIARNKNRPEGLTLVQGFAEKLPLGDASFDAAFASLVFCTVESPQAAFMELRRVVRPGGTVVLLDHVRPDGLLGPVFDLLNMIMVPLCGDHVNRRTAATARTAGLDVLRIQKRGLGIFNLITCRV
ncbi:MAG: methyltransferase domain-containing protein [Pyrinomonadaceae bacterium]|nr:methyltransferase domain-containing protein [Pyrinomonadaceae bacterium]